MTYDYDKTHESILASAARHFEEVGYRNASIRRICKEAGVTNGAFYAHFKSKEDLFTKLVEPALNGLGELYGDETSRYMEIGSSDDVLEALSLSLSTDRTIIHYIYEHADTFRLLLKASGGTPFDRFPAMLIEEEQANTATFFKLCEPYVKRPGNMSDNIVTQASSLVISTIFDCLLSGKTEEETLFETQLASEFCIAGLRRIWGI